MLQIFLGELPSQFVDFHPLEVANAFKSGLKGTSYVAIFQTLRKNHHHSMREGQLKLKILGIFDTRGFLFDRLIIPPKTKC